MSRDKQEAAAIQLYSDDPDSNVKYRVVIDFTPDAAALVSIDEEDISMLDDPEKFRTFTSANACIGLTTTPEMAQMETRVAEQLNFEQDSCQPDDTTTDVFEKLAVGSVIDAPDNKARVACI